MSRCRRHPLVFIAAVLGLGCVQQGDKSVRTDSRDTSAANPAPAPRAAPIASASAYLDRHRYTTWTPAANDDSALAACTGHDSGAAEGVEINALWGIARYRVLAAEPDARDSTNVNVSAEVVRVLSVEGDPATSDGNYAKADMVIAQPVIDTLWLALHRTSDGWIHCGFVWYLQDEVMSPIALTGPPADTLTPRGLPISRWVPSRVPWSRVRVMADSLARD